MTVQDWLAAYRISGSRFRLSLINMTALGIILIVLAVVLAQGVLHIERLWRVQRVFPWHSVESLVFSLAPPLAVGPAVSAMVLWLVSARQVVLDELGVTMQSKAGKGIIRWQQIADVTKAGDYVVICLKAGMIVIPRRAFPDGQAADSAYQKTLSYWRKAKGIPLSIPDTAGVWPPAPRPGNSVEPGDGPEC
jgi:hypothetical protein